MRNDVTIYVGIDFSKEKFNACLLMEQGVMGESEFPNSKNGLPQTYQMGKEYFGTGTFICLFLGVVLW